MRALTAALAIDPNDEPCRCQSNRFYITMTNPPARGVCWSARCSLRCTIPFLLICLAACCCTGFRTAVRSKTNNEFLP